MSGGGNNTKVHEMTGPGDGPPPAAGPLPAAAATPAHISVFDLDPPIPILNSCLALTRHLMNARNKTYVENAVLDRFSVEALMVAREVLFTRTAPKDRYSYRGPNNTPNPRDRALHAFDGIYKKFVELDALNTCPVIACKSDDLGMLLTFNNDAVLVENRFRKMETEMSELKRTFLAYTEVISSGNNFPTMEPLSSIHPTTRRRLGSESKKRRLDNGVEHTATGLSESDDSSVDDDAQSQYQLPKDQVKRLTRRSYSDKAKQGPPSNVRKPSNRNTNKPTATWGKASNGVNTNRLSGSPPEIFMFNCKLNTEEVKVKEHFEALGVGVQKVEKMTKFAEARSLSFRLMVSTQDDFEKIMSGEFTPQNVGVRRFIPARRSNTKESNFTARDSSNSSANSGGSTSTNTKVQAELTELVTMMESDAGPK